MPDCGGILFLDRILGDKRLLDVLPSNSTQSAVPADWAGIPQQLLEENLPSGNTNGRK